MTFEIQQYRSVDGLFDIDRRGSKWALWSAGGEGQSPGYIGEFLTPEDAMRHAENGCPLPEPVEVSDEVPF